MRPPTVLNFGGGINSAALAIGMIERDLPVDLVLFADTMGEKPETYEFVEVFDGYLVSNGYPPVQRVKRTARTHASLEEECLTNKTMPSLVYGFRSCSAKWKRDAMDKFIRHWPKAHEAWAAGSFVTRLLGIDAGEPHRGRLAPTAKWIFERPLIAWDWARDECVEAIKRAGLAVPPKSACFFCPASTKHEVRELARDHPGLFERAVAIEHAAADRSKVVKGLGRHWSWEEIARADKAQLRLFPETVDQACLCFDGSPES